MVSETGHIVKAFLTPGRFSDARGLLITDSLFLSFLGNMEA